jgi:NADH dehydrogenase [ubiquinone] 1 alpha subcomplex assembly factor 7
VSEPRLSERMAAAIAATGPIPLAHYMRDANAHYYATRDPFGPRGDFTTAPEVSQMFGELIGLWFADLWDRGERPPARYVEYGPGRGTLAADALRAMKSVGLEPPVHFIETSPVLRAAQAERVPDAEWHVDLVGVPDDAPLLVVANEFFDALPIRQLVRTDEGWRERLVDHDGTNFVPVAGDRSFDQIVPEPLRDAPVGAVVETCPAAISAMRQLAARLHHQGGVALIADYGYRGPAAGETLQAVQGHEYANPFGDPGERDLTAHVDFATLAEAAEAEELVIYGPVEHGPFLEALGIAPRAAALQRSAPDRAEEIDIARARLTGPDAMGHLFKILAVTAPGAPEPAGFA